MKTISLTTLILSGIASALSIKFVPLALIFGFLAYLVIAIECFNRFNPKKKDFLKAFCISMSIFVLSYCIGTYVIKDQLASFL